MKSSIKQNLILVTATVICMVLAFVLGINLAMPSVVALEQDARCGMVEHVHRDECYLNNVLICGERAHTHGENCYLLRLEDNDINRILSEIEADEEKSLEHVITNVVYKASYLELVNEGILPAPTPTPTPTPTPLIELLPEGSSLETLTATNASVAALNDSIEENNITPALYLNERLISPASEGGTVSNSENIVNLTQGQNSPTDLITYAAGNDNANGGISTLAITGSEGTNSDKDLNIYVQIDDDWVFAETVKFEVDSEEDWFGRSGSFTPYIARSAVTDAIKNKLGISQLTENNLTVRYSSYGSTAGSAQNAGTGTYNSTSAYTLGSHDWYQSWNGSNQTTARNNANSAKNLFVGRFYTVTINYIGGTPAKQYVQSGQTSTLPIDTATYEYSKDNFETIIADNQVASQLNNITSTTTLYARPKTITASFEDKDGNPASSDQSGKPTNGKFTVTLPLRNNSVWIVKGSNGNTYYAADGNTKVDITQNTTFVAVPAKYIVTFKYPSGSTTNQEVDYNKTITIPTLSDNYVWIGTDGSVYPGGATSAPIRSNITFTASSQVSASFVYKNTANNKTEFYTPGTTITLPTLTGNNVWVDELGDVYTGGTKVTLGTHKTFTEKGRIIITYNLNAPTSLSDGATGHKAPEQTPTIADSTGTTKTVTVIEGNTTVISGVIPRVLTTLNKEGGTSSKKQYKTMAFFSGWTLGSEVVLPNAVISYEALDAIDTNGTVTATGNWIQGNGNTANFFIDLRSNLTGSTSAEDYTPSIFTTFISHEGYTPQGNGRTDFGGTDVTKSAEYDATIRALVGQREGTGKEAVWLYSVPTDQQVFDYLKDYIGADTPITVDGITVTPSELNTDVFAIRWYNVNYWNTSGWHINASLVRKVGNIVVHKTFEGREDYILKAENGFTITARAGSLDANGDFVDNKDKADITLVTSRKAASTDKTEIGYSGERISTSFGDNGAVTVEYEWVIPNVGAGEIWDISENLVTVGDALGFGEWVIVDSSNNQSGSDIGTQTTVVGVTFPKDVSSDEWLRAEFTNLYYSKNSIMLRKVDGLSGARLNGAEFQLYQLKTDSNGNVVESPMQFNLDVSSDGKYRTYNYDPTATGAATVIKSDGTEINLTIGEFSFQQGSILVREVATPTGYVGAGDVVVGYTKDSNGDGIFDSVVGIISGASHATYSNNVLIIENSADTLDVEVNKAWRNCTDEEIPNSVVVQLLANGSANTAASVLPSGVSTIKTITVTKGSDGKVTGHSTCEWENLPTYIGGNPVNWTVKELAIGDEQIKADGTFPNWNSYVSLPTESIENGVKTATITVTNIPKTGTELRLIKKDNFNRPVPDVTFVLKDKAGTKVLNTLATDENGEIIFHNLKYATQYTLVEENIPVGYWGYDDPIKVTINEDGTVTILDGSPPNAKPSAQNYTIEVINYTGEPLPETGGMGTHIYTAGGLLLMAAAVALLIYRRKRRKEADLLDV